MTTCEAIALFRTEKAIHDEKMQAKLKVAVERLTAIEELGNPYRRRTDPLRRTGMLDKQYDPADALWRSLQPYHGEQKPR